PYTTLFRSVGLDAVEDDEGHADARDRLEHAHDDRVEHAARDPAHQVQGGAGLRVHVGREPVVQLGPDRVRHVADFSDLLVELLVVPVDLHVMVDQTIGGPAAYRRGLRGGRLATATAAAAA